MIKRKAVIEAAESVLADTSWPLGDSVEFYECTRAGALPSTDSELVAAILIVYCYSGDNTQPIKVDCYCGDTGDDTSWGTYAYHVGQYVLWQPCQGCMHVEEFTTEDAAYRVASAIEQPCRSRDCEFINRRVIEHCQRLGRTE